MRSLDQILIIVGLAVVYAIKAIIEVAIEDSKRKKQQCDVIDQLDIDENTKRQLQSLRVEERDGRKYTICDPKESELYTQADINYRKAVNSVRQRKDNSRERVAVACPNCGAPLKAIYERCTHCGMSYKEASSAHKSEGEEGDA